MTLECETSFEEDKNQCGSQIRDNEKCNMAGYKNTPSFHF